METCQSPRMAMLTAYKLARQILPDHTHKFSRKDFALPQLFACLVVREMLRLSYRKTETLLRDCMAWLAEIGLTHVPDHNTLWDVEKGTGVILDVEKGTGVILTAVVVDSNPKRHAPFIVSSLGCVCPDRNMRWHRGERGIADC